MNHQWPKRISSGSYDLNNKTWKWDKQSWYKCKGCGLYHGDRHIPEMFWKRQWTKEKKKNTAGVIVTRQRNFEREFFVIQSYHNLFGFPKGKQEPGETIRDAAARELKEETGIVHDLKNSLEFRQTYGDRQISFFLVELHKDDSFSTIPHSNNPEITSFGWIKEKDIYKLNLNKITQDTLKMFYKFF